MSELWLRIDEAAAAAARQPGAPPSSLLGVVEDLISRGAPIARACLDEAIAASQMGAAIARAVRADLLARVGDVAGYHASAREARGAMTEVAPQVKASLAAYLAAGAEALGLVDLADEVMPPGPAIATNAARAAERGDPIRAELLMRRPASKKLDWTSRVPVTIAVARAHARAGAADRAREVLAEAEASARRGKNAQLRSPLLVRVATAYADIGADSDARRLARELDRAMFDKAEPRGAIEYQDIAVVFHRLGAHAMAREIVSDIEATWVGRRDPLVAARAWALIDEAPRARRLLDPIEAAAERGEIGDDIELASIARTHLALGDVAAAVHRAATASIEHRVRLLREIGAYCHAHAVVATPAITAALAEVAA